MSRSRNPHSRSFNSFAKATHTAYRCTDKGFSSLAKWATKDHIGVNRALSYMPMLGFFQTCRLIIYLFLLRLLGILGTVVVFYLMIAYGLPYFLFGSNP